MSKNSRIQLILLVLVTACHLILAPRALAERIPLFEEYSRATDNRAEGHRDRTNYARLSKVAERALTNSAATLRVTIPGNHRVLRIIKTIDRGDGVKVFYAKDARRNHKSQAIFLAYGNSLKAVSISDEADRYQYVRMDENRFSIGRTSRPGGTSCATKSVVEILKEVQIAAEAKASLSATGMVEIDVLAMWTARRRSLDGTGSRVGTRILLDIEDANRAFRNSGIPIVLRLVYAGETAQDSLVAIGDELSAVISPADGRYDEIHHLRNASGADIAVLYSTDPPTDGWIPVDSSSGGCGIAPVDGNAAPFAVVRCMGNLVLAHEIGHLLGAGHGRTQAIQPCTHPYACGHTFRGNDGYLYRTLMSHGGGGASRIAHFSNPYVAYAGSPTGTPNEDNARMINSKALTVAGFRSPGSLRSLPFEVRMITTNIGGGGTDLLTFGERGKIYKETIDPFDPAPREPLADVPAWGGIFASSSPARFFTGNFNREFGDDVAFTWVDGSIVVGHQSRPNTMQFTRFASMPPWGPVFAKNSAARMFAEDATGDGLTDIIFTWPDGSIWVGVSTGTSFDFQLFSHWPAAGGIFDANSEARMFVSDVTGDRRADLVLLWTNGSITVGRSTGRSFNFEQFAFNPSWSGLFAKSSPARIFMGNFGGSANNDIMFTWIDGSISFGISDGNAFHFLRAASLPSWGGIFAANSQSRLVVGDFYGNDGILDIAFTWVDGTVWVGENNGGILTFKLYSSGNYGFNTISPVLFRPFIGDFNGDARMDVAFTLENSVASMRYLYNKGGFFGTGAR